MDGREFVSLVKLESITWPVSIILKKLNSPRALQPLPESSDPIEKGGFDFNNRAAQVEQSRAAWFQQLSEDQKAVLSEVLRECAELSALSFCTLIDGVGGSFDGVFKIHAVDPSGKVTLINSDDSEMLHDLLTEVCAEDWEC